MGGLDVRRKPFQDSPTPSANSVAAIALIRMHAFTGDNRYYDFAKKTLEAFAGIAPQYGLFAATYGLAATLFAHHPLQVVITGDSNDPAAQALEAAAHSVFRFGKSVLRFTPSGSEGLTPGALLINLAGALKETLPHLPVNKPFAVVCAGNTCLPPTSDPEQLIALLQNGATGAATS
jgi:uncharacterized protein YyaL (SSP411 family)